MKTHAGSLTTGYNPGLDGLFVTAAGLLAIAWIVWCFWLYRRRGVEVPRPEASRKCVSV